MSCELGSVESRGFRAGGLSLSDGFDLGSPPVGLLDGSHDGLALGLNYGSTLQPLDGCSDGFLDVMNEKIGIELGLTDGFEFGSSDVGLVDGSLTRFR